MLGKVGLKQVIEQVQALQADGRHDHALNIINQVIGQMPENPHLLYCLSTTLMCQSQFGMALVILHNVVRNHPDFAEAWNNLAVCYRREYHIEKAREAALMALSIRDDFADPYNNLAGTYVNEGCPAGGLDYADKAIARSTGIEKDKANFNKALMLLELGRWVEGFALYERGIDCDERLVRNYSEAAKTPLLRNIDDLKPEHTIVVYGEQGVGDEIMFASCLPDLINTGATVIIDCHPRMVSLFQRSFPGIEVHGTRKRSDIDWPVDRQIDWACPIGSLMYFFRHQDSDFPGTAYLKAEQSISDGMRDAMANGRPIIGLAWSGGTQKTNNLYRCLDREMVDKIAADKRFHFVSLEYTNSGYMPENVEPAWQITQYYNYDMTAALVEACDAVVSINTSVVHLAGAMGKRVFTLTPSKPAWRYGVERKGMPFYPDVHQYRQAGSNWNPALQLLRHDLNLWADLRYPEAASA